MTSTAEILRIAERVLRSNRYLAEADMCKEAAAGADYQYRLGYQAALHDAAGAVENYKGTVVLIGIAAEIRKLPIP